MSSTDDPSSPGTIAKMLAPTAQSDLVRALLFPELTPPQAKRWADAGLMEHGGLTDHGRATAMACLGPRIPRGWALVPLRELQPAKELEAALSCAPGNCGECCACLRREVRIREAETAQKEEERQTAEARAQKLEQELLELRAARQA